MFFVVTTGRSGSTTIARTLASLEVIHSVHEPQPALIKESTGYREGQVTAETVAAILRETRPATRAHGRIPCESNQTLSLLIPVLQEVFPQARFIWLIRNGFDVVASTLQKQWYTGHSENHDRYEDCPPIEREWIDGRARADRVGQMTPKQWENASRFEKCCWYWSYVNGVIGRDLACLPAERWFQIRLEDLESHLPALLNWMELTAPVLPPVEHHNVARRLPYHWSEWTPDEMRAFERWCGPLMDAVYPGWREVAATEHRIFIDPAIAVLQHRIVQLEEKTAELEATVAEQRKVLEERERPLAPLERGLLARLLGR